MAELASSDPDDNSYEPKLQLLAGHIGRAPRERRLSQVDVPHRFALWRNRMRRVAAVGTAFLRSLGGFGSRPSSPTPPVSGLELQNSDAKAAVPLMDINAIKTAGALRSAEIEAPRTGRFTEGRFSEESMRSFMVYEPARRRPGSVPLIVMLHGCQQGAADFAAGTRMNQVADEAGAVVLYPEQSIGANAMRCWNWYALHDRSNRRGDAALIAAMTRKVMREHDLDPTRVYVAGMSAGGAMAAVLARDYPGLYAAMGVHSGVPAGLAHDVYSAMQLMSNGPGRRINSDAASIDDSPCIAPCIVFHGDEDTTVHPSNGEAIHANGGVEPYLSPPADALRTTVAASEGRHGYTRSVERGPDGETWRELWMIQGAGHAWAGGSGKARHTDARGPDASREMMRFFLQHRLNRKPV
jgi:poly(hydroxyalkanoate) depolymerase family esterase